MGCKVIGFVILVAMAGQLTTAQTAESAAFILTMTKECLEMTIDNSRRTACYDQCLPRKYPRNKAELVYCVSNCYYYLDKCVLGPVFNNTSHLYSNDTVTHSEVTSLTPEHSAFSRPTTTAPFSYTTTGHVNVVTTDSWYRNWFIVFVVTSIVELCIICIGVFLYIRHLKKRESRINRTLARTQNNETENHGSELRSLLNHDLNGNHTEFAGPDSSTSFPSTIPTVLNPATSVHRPTTVPAVLDSTTGVPTTPQTVVAADPGETGVKSVDASSGTDLTERSYHQTHEKRRDPDGSDVTPSNPNGSDVIIPDNDGSDVTSPRHQETGNRNMSHQQPSSVPTVSDVSAGVPSGNAFICSDMSSLRSDGPTCTGACEATVDSSDDGHGTRSDST